MTLIEAVEVLVEHLCSDADYRETWQANIATAFYDTVKWRPEAPLSEQANRAAEYFLDNLCGLNRRAPARGSEE